MGLSVIPPATLAVGQDPRDTTPQAIIATTKLPWSRWPDFSGYVDIVARLYQTHPNALIWQDSAGATHQASEAMSLLATAGEHGLDPSDYDAATLESLARGLHVSLPDSDDDVRFDVLLSIAFLRYMDDLYDGRTYPGSLSKTMSSEPLDLASALSEAVKGDSVSRLALALSPRLAQYRNLRRELARYRALAADSDLPLAAIARRVRPGDRYDGSAALARRLRALGDLPARANTLQDGRYAGDLVEALRRFQSRHGLTPDGVLGRRTFEALNTPLSRRVRQIELALERLRWLPAIGQQRFVVVNIPAFQLFAFDSTGGSGAPALEMRVIVGKALDTRTPVLIEQLRYLEFQPYWNIPRSILVGEILPLLHRRPRYLQQNDMELVGPRDRVVTQAITPGALLQLQAGELRLRQRPSTRNPLGPVKFVFPNAADVYLHGTPDTALFAQQRRDFSHGCIRLERPTDLATWVLRDQLAWSRDSIVAAMVSGRTRRSLLTRPMPVILFYTTAVARSNEIAFFEDIYGHDRRLDEALRSGPTPP